jgi:prepilin-type N-terminal cleavage/methylation domain-containing protein
MRKQNHKHQIGFSIIELIISLFIVAVSLLIYQASLNAALLNKQTKYEDIALRIASSEVETLRAGGYAAVPSSGSFNHALLSTLPNGSGTLTVSAFNAKTKEVVVSVSWKGNNGTKTINIDTLITEIGGL